ncbi:MAG: glycine cleavage system protein GcvH [Candidatus Dormibacteraeota bacterium]|nr:glycine cleavage system protein GcvH [Candidatus Dormibacteraeota bacterium]
MPDLSGFKFTKTHEWVRPADGGEAFIGISDHAQGQLGDVIFLELPQVGARLEPGARLGAVESVKAASDLYAPAAGEVLEVNAAVNDAPELVNQDPYERGWLVKVRLDGELPDTLMDDAAYQAYADADQH